MTVLKAVRGTRDLLPPETELWDRVESTTRRVMARYHFGEIRTPLFEDTQLFARGVGEETDIVSKEMYTWKDGERFNAKKLIDTWISVNRSDSLSGFEPGKIAINDRDLASLGQKGAGDEPLRVWRASPGPGILHTAELIIFRATVSSEAIAILLKWQQLTLSDSSQRGFGEVRMRLVVPETSPETPWVDHNGVEVERFPGDYFSSWQSLTLRPENTAGVVRAYIEHKLGETGLLQKLYYIGPQFRRERPQKGRYRQFWQIGAEVIGPPSAGSESPLRDAEVIELLASLLDELGISGWTLVLNSVGSATDRPRYIAALREALKDKAPQMCVDCQRRAETNPLRVLDCKVPEDQPIIETLPKIADYLDDASKAHFAQVLAALDACGVKYEVNPRLVRGLDYYTRTTFEFTHGGLGAQNALLGGGRYDGLSEMLGGPKAPGIGFAMGLDRLILTLQAQQQETPAGDSQGTLADAYIAPLGEAQNAPALQLARELRREGLRIELGDGGFRLKKSFEMANKLARAIVLLGEDEERSGILTVKTFATGEQTKIPREGLSSFLLTPKGQGD
ncbi:MAG TPA: histidine--tRNA ligase [Acidobacteriaceae bacterium]|jgi:histidyl-tRNA synthetase|nr:histidine--tRNA ligase [Acidobacteriaceae bacterium]